MCVADVVDMMLKLPRRMRTKSKESKTIMLHLVMPSQLVCKLEIDQYQGSIILYYGFLSIPVSVSLLIPVIIRSVDITNLT